VPVPGHINPTLPVARALVHRGHRVRYFTSVALADRVAASGAEPVVYGPAVGPEVMRPPRSLTALARETDGLGAALLPDVLRTLRADPPDLVAYDSMCTWGHTAARAFPAMCWTATVALHASFRTAVFTSRAFQPGADLFDGEVAWVGYPPAELSTVSPRRHTYAALGTLFNERPEVFSAIAEPIDGEVLMAVGRADLGALGPLPERVRAVPWVDDQAAGAAPAVGRAPDAGADPRRRRGGAGLRRGGAGGKARPHAGGARAGRGGRRRRSGGVAGLSAVDAAPVPA